MNPLNPTLEAAASALGQQPPMKLKYVCLDVSGIPTPIIFPAHLPHDAIKTPYEVISAGFCKLEASSEWSDAGHCRVPVLYVKVQGHSHNLQKTSRPEDAEIIERAIR